MTVYRKHEPSADDLETAALHDLVGRMKRFRRGVALPVLIVATVMAWIGMALHALGYWSVIGVTSDGFYVVSAFTLVAAGTIFAAPVVVPGVAIYVALRDRLRRVWRADHRKGVSEEWLESNSRRYG